jgi:acetyl esterase/lipase
MEHPETGPLQDAQEALLYVRKHAKKLGINPAKTGVMGFSAGGHLASTLSTHFVYHKTPSAVRPDFSILIYPVISFSPGVTHTGSRDRLLGKKPTDEQLKRFSNELQVTTETPPAFLVHAKDDRVSVENTYLYRDALRQKGVTVETLLFEKGGHGYGMYNKQSDIFWPSKVVEWLKQAPLLCL